MTPELLLSALFIVFILSAFAVLSLIFVRDALKSVSNTPLRKEDWEDVLK